jgi:hypothetical protein
MSEREPRHRERRTPRQRIINADEILGGQKLHLNEQRLNFEAAVRHRLLRHSFGPNFPELPPSTDLERKENKFLEEAFKKKEKKRKSGKR